MSPDPKMPWRTWPVWLHHTSNILGPIQGLDSMLNKVHLLHNRHYRDCHPRRMCAMMRSTLKSLANFFKYRLRVHEAVFIYLNRVHLSIGNLAEFFCSQMFFQLVITEAVRSDIFESFCNGEELKSHDELYAN